MAKKNCWEYHQCGREPGGKNVRKLGVCPAARTEVLDGIHGGKNGGRACWVVAGIYCTTGSSSDPPTFHDCSKCEFWRHVRNQEGKLLEGTDRLIQKIMELETAGRAAS